MSLAAVLGALQNSAMAHAVSKSNHLVGAGLQVVHIFVIVLLLGALLLANLRLLGWVLPDTPLQVVASEVRRFFRIGVSLAAVSGTLIFIATAELYGVKWVFWLKMALLVAAVVVHVLLLSRVLRRWLHKLFLNLDSVSCPPTCLQFDQNCFPGRGKPRAYRLLMPQG